MKPPPALVWTGGEDKLLGSPLCGCCEGPRGRGVKWQKLRWSIQVMKDIPWCDELGKLNGLFSLLNLFCEQNRLSIWYNLLNEQCIKRHDEKDLVLWHWNGTLQ